MKLEARINSQKLAETGKIALKFTKKAGESAELQQGIQSLAQNAPEGSRRASFLNNTATGLNVVSIASKLYALIKPLTVNTR